MCDSSQQVDSIRVFRQSLINLKSQRNIYHNENAHQIWRCVLVFYIHLIFRVRRVQCSCALCTLLNIHIGFFACDFECQIFHIKSSKATLQIVNSQIPDQRKFFKKSTKNKNKVLENKGNFANSNFCTVFKLQSTIEILNRSR